jgi:serine/arginine repetitive matrix protein 2
VIGLRTHFTSSSAVTVPEAVDDTTTTPLPPDVLHGNFPIASQVIYIPADPEPVKGTHSNAPARIVPTPEVPPNGNGSGSLAIRAIRSMRSLARMASWATLRGEGEQPAKTQKVKEKKSKESIAKDSATLKKKKREPKENTGNVAEGDGRLTPRASMSNLESSALIHVSGGVKTLGRKKSSFIGLSFGLPSAVRLRQESAAPSAATAASQASVDASRTDRPSTAGSLRPVSIISSECSAHSRTSTGNGVTSNVSVRWDEDALARRRKEKEERKSAESATRGGEERKRVSDRRRRASVTSVFPDEGAHQPAVPVEGRVEDAREPSALTVKRKSRRKPVPEEECERGRPPTIHEGDGAFAFCTSILFWLTIG